MSTTPAAEPSLTMSADEVAALLKIKKATLYIWIRQDKVVRPIRDGKLKLWSRDEVENWIAAGCPDVRVWHRRRR